MQEKRLPAVGANDGAGRLIGLVTPKNIGEMTMIHPRRARNAWRSGPRQLAD